jgi:hypothetical protein
MAESFRKDQIYQNVSVQPVRVEGYSIVSVEARNLSGGRYKRDHQRLIAGPETAAQGQTIIYSDTYSNAPRPTTYAYARHDVDQPTFLSRLDEFVATAILVDFPELRNSPARCVIQTRDDLHETKFESYSEAVASLKAVPLIFARLYFAFGDMTVEFKEAPFIIDNELELLSSGILRKPVASPLFSFDVSNSDTWLSFLLSIHWARRLFPVSVLRSIARMSTPAVVE